MKIKMIREKLNKVSKIIRNWIVAFFVFSAIVFPAFAENKTADIGYILFKGDLSEYENISNAKELLDGYANKINELLLKNKNSFVRIYGYTAIFPNETDAMELSLNRANIIQNELINRGIEKSRFKEVIGKGNTNIWGNNSTEIERKTNRRVVISIEYEEQIVENTTIEKEAKPLPIIEKSKWNINWWMVLLILAIIIIIVLIVIFWKPILVFIGSVAGFIKSFLLILKRFLGVFKCLFTTLGLLKFIKIFPKIFLHTIKKAKTFNAYYNNLSKLSGINKKELMKDFKGDWKLKPLEERKIIGREWKNGGAAKAHRKMIKKGILPQYKNDWNEVSLETGKIFERKASWYYDKHHIKPRRFCGTNDISNLVGLHAKDHADHRGIHALNSPYSEIGKLLIEDAKIFGKCLKYLV